MGEQGGLRWLCGFLDFGWPRFGLRNSPDGGGRIVRFGGWREWLVSASLLVENGRRFVEGQGIVLLLWLESGTHFGLLDLQRGYMLETLIRGLCLCEGMKPTYLVGM